MIEIPLFATSQNHLPDLLSLGIAGRNHHSQLSFPKLLSSVRYPPRERLNNHPKTQRHCTSKLNGRNPRTPLSRAAHRLPGALLVLLFLKCAWVISHFGSFIFYGKVGGGAKPDRLSCVLTCILLSECGHQRTPFWSKFSPTRGPEDGTQGMRLVPGEPCPWPLGGF